MLAKALLPILVRNLVVEPDGRSTFTSIAGYSVTTDDVNGVAIECSKDYLADFELQIHRFGQKTTVAHLLHKPTNMAFVGVSFAAVTSAFNRKVGQESAVADACAQFMKVERYRLKWLAPESPNQPKT